MRAVDVIRKKRDGGELTPEEIDAFVAGATTGAGWADYQLSAWLMAVYFSGGSLAPPDQPQCPGWIRRRRTSKAMPGRAPRISTGPVKAWATSR